MLVPFLVVSLIFHGLDHNLSDAFRAMFIAFFLFLLVYAMRMISAGDVKLFAVCGAIVADTDTVMLAFVFYAAFVAGVGITVALKEVKGNVLALIPLIKRDLFGFITRTGPAIKPVRFPAAIVIGISVLISYIIQFLQNGVVV